MRPAFSVIFLTTLIGVGQGLFLALYTGEVVYFVGISSRSNPAQMMLTGVLLVLGLMALGVFASFFHLGRPERAWRAVAGWRTSWLSRELIVLVAFTGMVALWGLVRPLNSNQPLMVSGTAESFRLIVGLVAAILALVLYFCTAMIYVVIKSIQEWASPLTIINYLLLGLASGFTLATALASHYESPIKEVYAACAIVFILAATGSRMISLYRNGRIRRRSDVHAALGIHGRPIRQISQGVLDGAFNTREFFHHRSPQFLLLVKLFFPVATFVLPFFLVIVGLFYGSHKMMIAAPLIQYPGLLAERWFFFAQANHSQNIYYQG